MKKTALTLAATSALALAPAAAVEVHEVEVGGQTLHIPAPAQGFGRIDGISAGRDEIASRFISTGNRYVIAFEAVDSVAALRRGESVPSPRNFNAQTLRSLESRALTPAQFESLRAESERELERLGQRLDAVLGKVGADASKSLSERLQETMEVKIGDPVPLGTFERTRDSLGFAMMFKSQIGKAGQTTPGLHVVAALIVRVRDRLLYLYATSDRRSEADDAWVKSEVLKWRDAIFAANGQTDAPPSSTASRILQQFDFRRILSMAAVGAVAGALVGLAVFLARRMKHPSPPAP